MSTDAWDWYSSDQWATRDDAHHYVPTPTSTADGSPLTGDLADPDVRRLLHQLAPERWDCDTQWCHGCTAPACVSRGGGLLGDPDGPKTAQEGSQVAHSARFDAPNVHRQQQNRPDEVDKS